MANQNQIHVSATVSRGLHAWNASASVGQHGEIAVAAGEASSAHMAVKRAVEAGLHALVQRRKAARAARRA